MKHISEILAKKAVELDQMVADLHKPFAGMIETYTDEDAAADEEQAILERDDKMGAI